MRVVIAAPIVLPPSGRSYKGGGRFITPDETPLSSLRKRPHIDDPDVERLERVDRGPAVCAC